MRDVERNLFADAMRKLRTGYGAFFGDEAEWKQRLAVYFERLRKHELRDVVAALELAPTADYYPDRFPTVGQVQRLVIAAELERKHRAESAATAVHRQSEEERAAEEFSLLPISDEAQAQYLSAVQDHPFELLARIWQCESKRLGLDPNRPSPPEVAARRMAEFWQLWAAHEPQIRTAPEYTPRRHRSEPQPPASPAPAQE